MVLAAVIGTREKFGACEEAVLKNIASEIYPDDMERAHILTNTVKEYLVKIIETNKIDSEDLLLEIDRETRRTPRFIQKIDGKRLRRFLECDCTYEEKIFAEKVINFLERLQKGSL